MRYLANNTLRSTIFSKYLLSFVQEAASYGTPYASKIAFTNQHTLVPHYMHWWMKSGMAMAVPTAPVVLALH